MCSIMNVSRVYLPEYDLVIEVRVVGEGGRVAALGSGRQRVFKVRGGQTVRPAPQSPRLHHVTSHAQRLYYITHLTLSLCQ